MTTDMQSFDLYDTATSTAADVHGNLDTTPAIIRRVVEQHDGCALDDRGDRETLIAALTIALAGQHRG